MTMMMDKKLLTQEDFDSLYSLVHLSTYKDATGNINEGINFTRGIVTLSKEDCEKYKQGYTIVVQKASSSTPNAYSHLYMLSPRNGQIGTPKEGLHVKLQYFLTYEFGNWLPLSKKLTAIDEVQTYKLNDDERGKRFIMSLAEFSSPFLIGEYRGDMFIIPKDKCYTGDTNNGKRFRTYERKADGKVFTHACNLEDVIAFGSSDHLNMDDVETSMRTLNTLETLIGYNKALLNQKAEELRIREVSSLESMIQKYKSGEIDRSELKANLNEL